MGRTIQAKGFCFVEGTANRFYCSAQTNVLDSNEPFKGSKLQKEIQHLKCLYFTV